MVADLRLELVEAAIDEVIADVGAAEIDAGIGDRLLFCRCGELDGVTGDLGLSAVGEARDAGDLFAVDLAAVEVHLCVGFGWVFAKNGVEDDEGLHDEEPVDVGDFAQGLDAGGEEFGEGFAGSGAFELGDAVVERESLEALGGLLENLFEKDEAQGDGKDPEFFEQQGLGALELVEVDAERVGIPDGAAGGEIGGGNGDDAGPILMVAGDGVGQAAEFAAHGAELGENRARHAGILANFKERLGAGPAFGGQAVEFLGEGVELLAGGIDAGVKWAEIFRAVNGSPAVGVFAGGGTEAVWNQSGIPQALFVDHRYLSRHNTTP